MSEKVEKIFHAIDDLSGRERSQLFSLLGRRFQFVLSDDRAKFPRPWLDPQYNFGRLQCRLLAFLDGKGKVENRKIIEHLWKRELQHIKPETRPISPVVAKLLGRKDHFYKDGDECKWKREFNLARGRLRHLKCATNDRLFKLQFKWRIDRPKNGYLELKIM